MIQFNLLPDVKLDYIKAQRTTRLVLSVSVLVSIAAVALLLILLSIDGLQKKHLSDLSRDIKSESSKLQSEPQINKVLTVQNQLESLTNLHNQKPAVTQLFGYLNQITPNQVSITNLHFDFTAHTANITGTADSLSTVNKYVDTLKFTTYTASGSTTSTSSSTSGASCATAPTAVANNGTAAFTNVVLSNFGLNSSTSGSGSGGSSSAAGATFQITFSFDPTIFDITKTINLSVPNLTTTRSCLDQPNDLFSAATSSTPSVTSNGTSGGGQ